MIPTKLREAILEGQASFAAKKPLPRDIAFDPALVTRFGKVITVSGVRRAGKTMFLKQLAEQMTFPSDKILFLDFSESILSDFSPADFEVLPMLFSEICHEPPAAIFFDEIQEVAGFESGLRLLQNRGFPIFVTGSSAQLFSRDIASKLRGKTAEIVVRPLSFREFLRFRGFGIRRAYRASEKARLSTLVDEFIAFGGFPEVVLCDNPDTRSHLLKGYLDTMLLRDVIEKNNVKNVPLMQLLLSKVIRSFTRTISVHKWYNDFKSMGHRVAKDTLYLYLNHLAETGFIHLMSSCEKGKESAQKVYLADNGLYAVHRSAEDDRGKRLENAVYCSLARAGENPRYFNSGSAEVDFVCASELVQCCYSLDGDNVRREIAGFDQFEARHGKRSRMLVVREMDRGVPPCTVRFEDFALAWNAEISPAL